jgi:acyl carrier protein
VLTKKSSIFAEFPKNIGVNVWRIFTVLDRTGNSSADRVARLVRELLAKRAIDKPVGQDDSLSEIGLSSLDIVNLMLGVETEFAVKIPDREMTPSNFRSIAQIDRLVSKLLDADLATGR